VLVLNPGDLVGVIISSQRPQNRDPVELLQHEKQRRQSLLATVKLKDDLMQSLVLAADQFVVQRGDAFKTIIAGYHWFTDWGRDTMIALTGITLVTGRFEDARQILAAFADHTSQGMLPNRFADSGDVAEYNTVDATLWFFIAVHNYFKYSGDSRFVEQRLLPVLREIIEWHERGTRFNIHMDADGLLYAGEPGVQLTWMDAKIGDWVVTPRTGKTVEINALWYNAHRIMAEFYHRFSRSEEAEPFYQRAENIRSRFSELFWCDAGGYLYDVVDGEKRDSAVRPNQIFALSLPFALLNGERARKLLQKITDELFTPYGLRSLSAQDAAYRPRYIGNAFERDSAYHQGTVWGWLLGPYITALVRVEGDAGRTRAVNLLKEIENHLADAGIGTISEIFDAEAPHMPRGCIAQAWSVAEILRSYMEDVSEIEYCPPSANRRYEQFEAI
jgi:predicted glycogen debranching enzyme